MSAETPAKHQRAYIKFKGLIAKQDVVLAQLQVHHDNPEVIDAALDVRYELRHLRDTAFADASVEQEASEE